MNAPLNHPLNRRQAILSFFGVLGALAVPAYATNKPERKLLLNRVHIAGFQYQEGMEFRTSVHIGDRLELISEPDNPNDCYAVAFNWNGHHIGYVPRTENRHLSRLLRQDCTLVGIVTKTNPQSSPFDAVKADVFLLRT